MLLTPIATIRTPTIHVQVGDGTWTEPTQVVNRFDQPMMSFLMFGSGYSAEGAFGDGATRQFSRVGRVLFTPPDRDVVGRGPPGRMRVVSCAFDRQFCERNIGSFDSLTENQLVKCLDVPSSLLPSIFTRLMTEAMHPGFVSSALAESLGQAMLLEWSSCIRSPQVNHRRARLLPRHFRLIEEYLADLNCESPSVAAIARVCGFSERYFAKLFREQMNQSIGQYLRAAQIARAQNYLMQTDLPLKEVAHLLGFSSPATFSDAFRDATGGTPGNYRRTHRSGAGGFCSH